jgi:hypothetical protein
MKREYVKVNMDWIHAEIIGMVGGNEIILFQFVLFV